MAKYLVTYNFGKSVQHDRVTADEVDSSGDNMLWFYQNENLVKAYSINNLIKIELE